MIRTNDGSAIAGDYDVHIVGAGPVGIALALGCEARGLSVLLLESGGADPSAKASPLSAGHIVDNTRHASPDVAMRRGLGGTSSWWGGRCVAFDDIDFMSRPHVADAAWPFSHDEVRRYYPAAAEFLGIGPAHFSMPIAGWDNFRNIRFADLERWTPKVDMGKRHRPHLEQSQRITVLLNATVTGLEILNGTVNGLIVATTNGSMLRLQPRQVVLACGGLETTRLLLKISDTIPEAFGAAQGVLGRYYMGHISGKIADLVLAKPTTIAAHDYFTDAGAFIRRRFSLTPEIQQKEGLLNAAFWADNPPFHSSSHRSGILSLVWLALLLPVIGRRLVSEGVRRQHVGARPRDWRGHLRNIFTQPASTLRDLWRIVQARYLAQPSSPGFLVRNQSGRYALHYHAEQSPDANSSVALTTSRDPLEVPFLRVDLRFREQDAESILRSHEILDADLREFGIGFLQYYETDRRARISAIMRTAADGYHQIGTTRMGEDPTRSVVDPHCRVHGLDNLHVASTSVFPSSGQANPTFLAVALAFRLAERLTRASSEKGQLRITQ